MMNLLTLMMFVDMKKPRIKYLELDEFSYIENDIIKSRLNEEETNSTFLSWDEGWERVKMIVRKVMEYENNNS